MPEIPAEAVQAAVLARVEKRIAENYQDAEGRSPVDPHAVAVIVAPAALAAIAEQGMVIVSAEDLRAVVGETRSYETYTAALPRLRAVLSGTAPQPSETPQNAQTAGGGISGRSDPPGASTGLSDARAEEAEEALDSAQQALARVVQHARNLASYRPVEADALAAVILGLDPRDCRPGAALALLEQEAWTRG